MSLRARAVAGQWMCPMLSPGTYSRMPPATGLGMNVRPSLAPSVKPWPAGTKKPGRSNVAG